MKAKFLNVALLFGILFIITSSSCSDNDSDSCNEPKPCVDCGEVSFIENYSMNIPKDDIFFIKGIALDVLKYGRNIKVIEDLKGNFVDKSSIFVWGAGFNDCDLEVNRWDIITQYHKNDTLIMILEKMRKKRCNEKLGDYTTITCAYSVLNLSNGYVTGYIYPYVSGEKWEEKTVSWKEFQELLTQPNR